jgi:Pyridoxamine 5'-phosphate oxidase
MQEQRRGRRIAMTTDELTAHLDAERTCTLATIGPHGPHATALWFVWDGTSLWMSSITRSQRWTDLGRDPRVAVLVEAGEDYSELRGVEITGRVEVVGEVPRTGVPEDALVDPERRFAAKYQGGGDTMVHDGRHAWLRLTPSKIASWDFRKLTS